MIIISFLRHFRLDSVVRAQQVSPPLSLSLSHHSFTLNNEASFDLMPRGTGSNGIRSEMNGLEARTIFEAMEKAFVVVKAVSNSAYDISVKFTGRSWFGPQAGPGDCISLEEGLCQEGPIHPLCPRAGHRPLAPHATGLPSRGPPQKSIVARPPPLNVIILKPQAHRLLRIPTSHCPNPQNHKRHRPRDVKVFPRP